MQSDSETEPESDVPSESQGNLESPSSGWFMHQDPIWNMPAEDTHATERLRVVEEAVIHLLGFTVPELDIVSAYDMKPEINTLHPTPSIRTMASKSMRNSCRIS